MTDIANRQWTEAINRLRAVVRRRGVSEADADDVVQSALEKALRKLDTLELPDRFNAWTNQIAANAALDEVRRTVREPVQTDLDADATPAVTTEEAHSLLSFADCVHPLLKRLPSKDAELLRLKDLEGRTFVSLVNDYGLSVPGLKSRVQRARRQLAKEFEACCAVLRNSTRAVETPDQCDSECCKDSE